MSEVLKHLRDAEALAERIADVRRQGWTACYLCQYLWAVGDHEQALEAGDRARAIARDLDDVALAAESGFYRGIALLALGRVADAEGALAMSVVEVDAALVRGEHRFPSRRFGRNGPVIVRGFLSSTLGELGRFAEGRRHGQAAIRIAEAAGSPFALVAATGGLGALYVRQGDPANAIPILERGLAACRAHRLYNWFSHVAASLGRAYLAAGRIDEGRVLLEESATLGEHTGVAVDRARWLTYLGEGHLAVGRVGEAKRAADQALALARSNKERGHEAWALRLLGQVAVETGAAPDEAVALFRQALTLAEDLGLPPLQARCHHALGMVLARKDRAAAARHAERAVELAREIDLVLPEGSRASEPAGPRPATVAQD
jgi:tetratricopeptide (TPR) repeat protein